MSAFGVAHNQKTGLTGREARGMGKTQNAPANQAKAGMARGTLGRTRRGPAGQNASQSAGRTANHTGTQKPLRGRTKSTQSQANTGEAGAVQNKERRTRSPYGTAGNNTGRMTRGAGARQTNNARGTRNPNHSRPKNQG